MNVSKVILTALHAEVTDLFVVRIRGELHRAGQQQGQPVEREVPGQTHLTPVLKVIFVLNGIFSKYASLNSKLLLRGFLTMNK